jgi:hypothetical protein
MTLILIPNAIIQSVGKDAKSWKRTITQWYDGDSSKGLIKPLSEWLDEWHTGNMHLFTGTHYSQRKLLAKEYEQYMFSDSLGSNLNTILVQYGKGQQSLHGSIS